MVTIFAFVFNIVFGIVRSLVAGWCLACYWAWFIVTTFHVPELDYLHAVGVTMTVSFMVAAAGIAAQEHKSEATSAEAAFGESIGRHIGAIIIFPFLTGIAYVWHLYIG